MPTWGFIVLGCYAAASIGAFIAYFLDKRAASAGTWRIRERTLHLIELFGGWPGALAAQKLFRHKTQDRSFRTVFWLIVVVHAAAWSVVAWRLLLFAPAA